MARTLHLIKGGDNALASATILRQLTVGDTVSVIALPGAHVPPLPPDIVVQRVPDDLSWEQVLEAMFLADQVIAW